MDPGDLTPFGLAVEFLEDGRALLRVGAILIALSPKQVQELRRQLGVGNVQVINTTPFPVSWALRSAPTDRPGGKNYTITLSTQRDDPAGAERAGTLPPNVRRLPSQRKKKEKP